MKFGFTTMSTPEDLRPEVLARALEERGYESLWVSEHSHIPASRQTPYPMGGELPSQYTRIMDPFVVLTAAAMATTELRLGTGVALPLEHDVFALAKTVATLDVLSKGRLLFGVGAGWNVEELADHRPDIPWRLRYQATGECVGALRALWGDEPGEYHGRWFDFDPVLSFPKPMQRPGPPVLCGMNGRVGTQGAVAWMDAWMPLDTGAGELERKLAKVRAQCEEIGRDPDTLSITVCAFGDPDRASLEQWAALGVERVVIGSGREGWADPSTTLPFIDRYVEDVRNLS